MKTHVFRISYCLRAPKEGKPNPDGVLLVQTAINVAGETQGDAVTLLSKQFDAGTVVEVQGIANGDMDVLIPDVTVPTPSIRAEELEKLQADNVALTAKIAEMQTVLDKVQAADAKLAAEQSPAVPHS